MTMQDTSPLAAEVRQLIKARGPMPLARYMSLSLTHPDHGYYMSRDPFGVSGDFTTAPEISQMFGELIGLWVASVWQSMGSPESINFIELGPGRGTLMADALRAAKVVPAFDEAITDLSHSLNLRTTAEGYFELGRTLAQAGRPNQALEAYSAALKIDPDYAEAQKAAEALRQK